MKVCFLLQRRFAYIGHAMALTFRKKYGINKFCGYVETRPSYEFLKSQKDISYTKLLLDEEIHKQYKSEKLDLNYLKQLEQDYGIPNLWPYIESDRVVRYNQLIREYPYDTPEYTHEEMMKILQVKARTIIKFIEEEKPDILISSSALAGIDSLLLYYAAKKGGVKIFIIQSARVHAACSVSENYGNLDYVEETYGKIQKNREFYPELIRKAEEFINSFRNKPAPHYTVDSPELRPVNRYRQFIFLRPDKIMRSVTWLTKIIFGYISDKYKDDYTTIKPWHYILDRIKRKIRVLIGFNDLYSEVNLDEKFAFYPLQLEPEVGSLLFAPFYSDQLWLIKKIARSLPIDYKLYVKEHPAMFGYRPRRYYKELKKVPNVKLIKPTVMSFDLIKNARLVVTLTGSAGWEAILFKKPVITFGKVFYNKLPMVKICRAIEDLPYLVKEQLEKFNHDEAALINLIAAIYKESANADLSQLWNIEGGDQMEKKEHQLTPLVDLIAEKLNIKPLNLKPPAASL